MDPALKEVRIEESPRRRPGKPGPGNLAVTDWEPRELYRLRGALGLLRFVAYGAGSPGLGSRVRGSAGQWSPIDPDKLRAKRRAELRRLLDGCDKLARDLITAVRWNEDVYPRCCRCQTDLRTAATYCDRCGARQKDPVRDDATS